MKFFNAVPYSKSTDGPISNSTLTVSEASVVGSNLCVPSGDRFRFFLWCGNLIGDKSISSLTGVEISACGVGPKGGHGWYV